MSHITRHRYIAEYEEDLRAEIRFLKKTMERTLKLIKHSGADISDIDKMPFEQLIGREFNKLKSKK